MKVTFTRNISLEDSMIFEAQYEENLQLDREEKEELLENAILSYILVDGNLAGETYGIQLKYLKEEIEDCQEADPSSIYCYSTTILPAYQGKGLSKLLKSFWLGQCLQDSFCIYYDPTKVIGHSTSEAMKKINEFFGAVHSIEHKNWHETNRTAYFYRLELK